MKGLVSAFLLIAVLLAAPPAQAIDTAAREAILLDPQTGAVLMEKDSDVPMPPASMSKIMTTYVVFKHLQEGSLSLDDELLVSEKAWRMGGSKMFVELGSTIRVEDLLRGVIIQSGNDACVVLAEGIAGSEEAFAEEMTDLAEEIGLKNSHFTNATGWPDPNHWMTAADLAHLAERLITNFPEHYHLFSETEFTWHDITQQNRNRLLYRTIGADGLKTGHTEEAGYGLTASAVQAGRRLIVVVNGLESDDQRTEEAERLLSWGFREFDNYDLLSAGEVIGEAEVWMGQADRVPLVAPSDLTVTLPRAARREMKATLVYEGPVEAPIVQGQQIATLKISAEGIEDFEIPLEAANAVEELGPMGRIMASLKHLILGNL